MNIYYSRTYPCNDACEKDRSHSKQGELWATINELRCVS